MHHNFIIWESLNILLAAALCRWLALSSSEGDLPGPKWWAVLSMPLQSLCLATMHTITRASLAIGLIHMTENDCSCSCGCGHIATMILLAVS